MDSDPAGSFACIIFVVWIVSIIVAGAIGDRREATYSAVALGVLLGPLGVLITALAIDGRAKCPHCGTRRERGFSVCPACRREVAAA